MNSAARIESLFQKHFGGDPIIVRSPGRVNLIGEHTDYNEGFVLPASIDKAIVLGIAATTDNKVRFYAADVDQHYEASLDTLRRVDGGWRSYFLGVVDQMMKAGARLRGFNCVFGGDIPPGAGLSSSAAMATGLAYALNELFDLRIESPVLARLAQKAEQESAGVRCGIMDQFVNLFGREGHAVKLDCRSLEYEYVPFDRQDIQVVLCDTLVRHDLASSEYNTRRRQCESAVELLQKYDRTIRTLRDAGPELIERRRSEFDPVVYRRCAFVLHENARVLSACDDLKAGDFHSFGKRMFESHEGLRDEFGVSCPELDLLVDAASRVRGVFGARMMGAGFGGCTVNLVERDCVGEFGKIIGDNYRREFQKELRLYMVRIVSGTSRVTTGAGRGRTSRGGPA